MDATERDDLVEGLLAHWQSDENGAERARTGWALDRLLDLTFKGAYEDLWELILGAYQPPMSDEAIAVLAAGPVEDLLCLAGATFIDRIEALAAKDERFNQLLGGVWKSSIRPDVWARVEKARRSTW